MDVSIHHKIHELLMRAAHPVLVCDRRIDGDSLGSALAVADYLQSKGKRVPIFVSEPIPVMYADLVGSAQCTTDKSIFTQQPVDLLVVFDCSEQRYVDEVLALCAHAPTVVNMDHHATNSRYGDVVCVDTQAAATALLVHRWFVANNIVPSTHTATCLLSGICFDTGMFMNSATNSETLDAASDLVRAGARTRDVIVQLFQNKSVDALRVWGAALSRLHEMPEERAVATCILRQDLAGSSVTQEDVGGLSNFLSLVLQTDTVYVLQETAHGIRVSMRSSEHDVGKLAALFGGGGHAKAAGFSLEGARIIVNPNGAWRVEKPLKT